MAALALVMLGLGLVLMLTTGWASYAVLLAVACAIAGVGLLTGGLDATSLLALPGRLVGLLEHDLLQAVALYALVGALLRHVGLVSAVHDSCARALRRTGLRLRQRQALAGCVVGALTAPLNGSVGASAHMMAHAVMPRWRESGWPDAASVALGAVTATLGLVVPPSLVLLLLGDAMLRAHTEGLSRAGVTDVRVINTQDLVQACAPVALVLALAWAAVAVWKARAPTGSQGSGQAPEEPAASSGPATWIAPLCVLVLMGLVAVGQVRPVEAAATAALGLCIYAAARGQLAQGGLADVLNDAMVLTGTLFALLVAAATLSLVLRAVGCDRLVEDGLARLAGHPAAATLAVLAGMLALAFVLDAFEMVFLVVPIVMPPLLAQVPDAVWVACLTMLVLQAGYLLPPFGYAVVVSRSLAGSQATGLKAVALELRAYLLVLAAVLGLVLAVPGITHWWRTAPNKLQQPNVDAAEDLLRSMSQPRQGAGGAAP